MKLKEYHFLLIIYLYYYYYLFSFYQVFSPFFQLYLNTFDLTLVLQSFFHIKDLFLPLCGVGGNRFEYEMNVLKFLVKENIPINRVDIKTIYNDNGSHYNIFRDSFNIFMNIINKNNF